jgi:hypothetical protein
MDFLRKFWIEPGDDFIAFLSRLKDNDLSFLVEVSDDGSAGHSVSDAIDEQIRGISARGGPSVPEPASTAVGQAAVRWEFLSCKCISMKPKDLRRPDPQHGTAKKPFIGIAASSKMLAPVERNVKAITKEYGFKNPLREHDHEPEKFVIIGA